MGIFEAGSKRILAKNIGTVQDSPWVFICIVFSPSPKWVFILNFAAPLARELRASSVGLYYDLSSSPRECLPSWLVAPSSAFPLNHFSMGLIIKGFSHRGGLRDNLTHMFVVWY